MNRFGSAIILVATLAASCFAQQDEISVRRAVTGLGEVEQVGSVALLPEGADPKISLVGYLQLDGDFDAASVIADNIDREVVKVEKQSDSQWVILGRGKVFIVATLVTQEPLGIEQRRYTVTIDEPDEPPDPDEPPPPDPDDDHPEAELIRQVRDWAKAVNDQAGSQALALAYRQVAEGVVKGDVLPANGVDVVRNASDAALNRVDAQGDWTDFRSHLSAVFGERINQGKFATPEQVSGVFVAVAEGLIATAISRSMSLDESSAVIHGVFQAIKEFGQ